LGNAAPQLDISKLGLITGNKVLVAQPGEASSAVAAAAAIPCQNMTKASLTDGFQTFAYSLTREAAVSLNFWGSSDLSASDRVVLYQFAWYKDNVEQDGAVGSRCGAGVILALKVSNAKTTLDITLPTLAANAQLGQVSIQYKLSTFGLSGNAINAAIPSAAAIGKFDTESYAALMQSITSIQNSYKANATELTVTPRLISAAIPTSGPGFETTIAIQTFAINQLALGNSCRRAKDSVPDRDGISDGLVSEVYSSLGASCGILPPSGAIRQKARDLLARYRLTPA
jgi:hypothetical protein